MKHVFLALLAFVGLAVGVNAQQLAFPGADGYARYVTGGRGGNVLHVTRLDDCSDADLVPGTFRWALRSGDNTPRTIVFDVCGTINITSPLKSNHNNVSILGQSAPGGGICITGYGLEINGNRNYIIRYVRFRAGEIPCYAEASQPGTHVDVNNGSLGVENSADIIIDHCSMTWSNEECVTLFDDETVTLQHCIVGEGLYHSWHHKYDNNGTSGRGYAMQLGGENTNMHHSLITNCNSRSPRYNGVREEKAWQPGVAGIKKHAHDCFSDVDFSNNVTFNWAGSGSIYGGEFYASNFKNAPDSLQYYCHTYLTNNYYRPGPATKAGTKNERYFVAASGSHGGNTLGQWYFSGNKFEVDGTYSTKSGPWAKASLEQVNSNNLYGIAEGKSDRAFTTDGGVSQTVYDNYILKTKPELSGYVPVSAEQAYTETLADCGANLPRLDEVDQRLVDEAAGRIEPQFIGSRAPRQYGIIDTPNDIVLKGKHDLFYHKGVLTDVVNGQKFECYPYLGLNDGEKYAVDSDGDGLPDAYEDANGLNKMNAADGKTLCADGYSNLEHYLNGIAAGTIKAADYQTSEVFVQPGEAVHPESVTITFTTKDSSIRGTVPAQMTIPYGGTVCFKANSSLYKEGYTMVGWTDGNMTYKSGQQYDGYFISDVTLWPAMVKNNANLSDRTDDITIQWDFSSADAPALSNPASKGIYVTRTYIDADSLDVMLEYNGTLLTIPACEGAIATASYASGQKQEFAAVGNELQLTISAPDDLQSVSLMLPFAFVPNDNTVFHSPVVGTCTVGKTAYTTIENGVERVWGTEHNISNAQGFKPADAGNYELVYGNLATVKSTNWMATTGQERDAYRNCIDPIKDDGTFSGDGASTTALDGFIVGASSTSTYKLMAYVKDCARVRTFVSGSNSNGDQVQLIALPADGSERVTANNMHLLNKSTVWSESFDIELDPDKQYMLMWSSISGYDMMIGAIKIYDKTGAGATEGDALVMWPWQGTFDAKGNTLPAKAFAKATASHTGFSTIGSSELSDGSTTVTFKPEAKVTERTEGQMVELRIKPAAGYLFKPTQLAFNGSMTATSGGNLDIYTKQGTADELLQAEYVYNKIGNRTIDLLGYDASYDEFIVRFYCYNLAAKQLLCLNNVSVSGTFAYVAAEKHSFTTTVTPEGAGVVTQTPKGNSFVEGAEVTLTATAVDGYAFESWTDDKGNELSKESKFVFSMPANDVTLTANFRSLAESGIFSDGPFQAIVSNAEELKEALVAAKQNKDGRYYIFLKNGIYDLGKQAKTAVPANTSLIGESQEGVLIVNNPGAVTTSYQDSTPTLFIDQEQNDVYLQDITIRQDRDWTTKVSTGQALALRQRGKRAIYKNVTMQGVQDTYYLNKADGSAYFETSTVAGNVDYIYGDGTIWLERCNIEHIGKAGGFVTAANTQAGYMGMVFNECNVTSANGDHTFYLGRPWNDSPAVTYLNTTFNSLPKDEGWAGMTNGCVLRFHEYGSKDKNGNILDLSKRSISACAGATGSDAPVLTAEQAGQYTLESVFQKVAPNWNPQILTRQIDAPTLYISKEKKQLTWNYIEGAMCYAIFKDGGFVGFTTKCAMDINNDTDLNATFTIRVANAMGGLGAASAPAVEGWTDGISMPSVHGNTDSAYQTYNLAGQQVNASYKGMIIKNGKKINNK